MSTVVHVVELIMVSLIGIMFYKLYSSYKSWKTVSTFSSKTKTNTLSVSIGLHTEKNAPLFIAEIENSDYLSETRMGVAENELEASQENTATSILNDYIGEFFFEVETVDIDAYRATQSVSAKQTATQNNQSLVMPNNEIASRLDQTIDEVDVIKVESQSTSAKVMSEDLDVSDSEIPTLKDFSDVEPDSFITVASVNDEEKDSSKIMSDKVVMAMLDEAKLVCAS